ncbi:hypothetical protein UFOVP826_24 [uncultured Caudovirales phage]|uniref:Uncharacterized protein n=1 Tax=uncultured Caudovirales phage TaxID=2100421 RepID=A0A6J5NZS3_9CAUD|nr:hypothetical protein UFOVP826_24 [uncultured Caudovirales phage]
MNRELLAKDQLVHGLAVAGFDYPEICELFNVSRADVRRAIRRAENAELGQWER